MQLVLWLELIVAQLCLTKVIQKRSTRSLGYNSTPTALLPCKTPSHNQFCCSAQRLGTCLQENKPFHSHHKSTTHLQKTHSWIGRSFFDCLIYSTHNLRLFRAFPAPRGFGTQYPVMSTGMVGANALIFPIVARVLAVILSRIGFNIE